MRTSHPYISGAGNIAKMISHLRRTFPPKITSQTVKKLGIASNNESHLVKSLQFVNVIDTEFNKTDRATDIFSEQNDEEFQKGFAELVKGAYGELFGLYGDDAWELDQDELVTFFRKTDNTSATIGKRQAASFMAFAGLADQRKPSKINTNRTPPKQNVKALNTPKKKATSTIPSSTKTSDLNTNRDIGLTVRVEINLPGDGTKETYDNIFQSIRRNLIDG